MQSNQNIFNIKPILYLKDTRITAIDYQSDKLFCGDQNGIIYRYSLDFSQPDIVKKNSEQPSKKISKKRIDQIKCIKIERQLLVQTDYCLAVYDQISLQKIYDILQKDSLYFVMNDDVSNYGKDLLVISRKKEGIFYRFDSQRYIQNQSQNIQLPEIPQQTQWLQDTILVVFQSKKQYSLFNLKNINNSQPCLSDITISNTPFIKTVSQTEFMMTSTDNNVGIFVNNNGNVTHRNSLLLDNEQKIINMSLLDNYLIVMYEYMLKIFNMNDSKCYQKDMKQKMKDKINSCITSSDSKHVFYANQNDIYYFCQIPYDIQIKNYITNCDIEEAMQIFNQNVIGHQKDRNQKEQQLKINSSMPLFKKLSFDRAYRQLKDTNFDIREYLYIFEDLYNGMQRTNEIFKSEFTQKLDFKCIVSEQNNKNVSDTNREMNIQTVKAKQFLLKLMLNSKENILKSHNKNLNQKTEFINIEQQYDGIIFYSISYKEILELVDYSLIRVYCYLNREKKNTEKELKKMLQQQIYVKDCPDELRRDIEKSFEDTNLSVLAKFYENTNRYKVIINHYYQDALDQWRKIGQKNTERSHKVFYDEAVNETLSILGKVNNSKQIFEYLKWIISEDKDKGLELFKNLSEEVVTMDQMLHYFQTEFIDSKQQEELIEKYLEVMIYDKKIDDEKKHTKLALNYLQKINEHKQRDDHEFKKEEINSHPFFIYLKKLDKLLRYKDAQYKVSKVLDIILQMDSKRLIQQEIYLYEKERSHEQAMKRLVQIGNFEMAEKYCAEQQDMLLNDLFIIYKDSYMEVKQKSNQDESNQKLLNELKDFQKILNNFLKKYGTHDQLDPLYVLRHIPDDWEIEQDEEYDGLYAFLKNISSHTLNKKRNLQVTKNLSEMNLLNTECKLVKAKQANVLITQDRKCAKCGSKIGSYFFVVFPNGITYHQQCVNSQKLNICPSSGFNFEQNFQE